MPLSSEVPEAGAAFFDRPLWDAYAPFFDAEEGTVFPDDTREEEFYRLVRSRVPGGRCLEIGAGTGRLAGPLSSAGPAVFLEPSPSMLGLWRRRPGRRDMLLRAVGQAMPFHGESFDLVIFACNGLHCLPGRDSRVALLVEAARVLIPGGWLVLETSPALARRPPERDAQRYDYFDGSLRLRLVESVALVESRGTILFDMAYSHGPGRETRIRLELALIDRAELLDELAEAGLSVVHEWGDYDFSAPGDSSPRMLTVASTEGSE